MKRLVVLSTAIIVTIVSSGWGFLVHKTTEQLAVYELPQPMQGFFYKNLEYIVYNSVRPDVRRNTDSTEAPKHFIDLEMYGDSSAWNMPCLWDDAVKKYSADTLYAYGYVPYVINAMQQKLTAAFKSGNKDSILFYAADIGHYIGDANVPLHTTVNYDGQLSDQKGLHSLWESTVPQIEIANYTLNTNHKASFVSDPEKTIWIAIRNGNKLVPDLLAKEKEVSKQFTDSTKFRVQMRRGKESKSYSSEFAKAYAASLKNTINDQLITSANMIADFWFTAWVNAGKPDLSKITNWSDEDSKKLNIELEAFKTNKLINQSLLQSLKPDPAAQ
jgi:hypothetical protein